MSSDDEERTEKELRRILGQAFSDASYRDELLQSIYVTEIHTRVVHRVSIKTIASFEVVDIPNQGSATRLFVQDDLDNPVHTLDVFETPDQILDQLNGKPSGHLESDLIKSIVFEQQKVASDRLQSLSERSNVILDTMKDELEIFAKNSEQRIEQSQKKIDDWQKGKNLDKLKTRSQSFLWRQAYRFLGRVTLDEYDANMARRRMLEKDKIDAQRGMDQRLARIEESKRQNLVERERLEKMISDPQMSEKDRKRLQTYLRKISDYSYAREFRFVRQTEAERDMYVREKNPERVKDRSRERECDHDRDRGPRR